MVAPDEIRVRLKEGKREEVLGTYVRKKGGLKDAAESLGLSPKTFYNYYKGYRKTVPKRILEKIVETTGHSLEDVVEEEVKLGEFTSQSLRRWAKENPEEAREIRERNLRKGRERAKQLGKNTPGLEKARQALREKYGENWGKVICQLARQSIDEETRRERGRKAWRKLVEVLGEEGAREYRRKILEENLLEHYGHLGDLNEIRKLIGQMGGYTRWQELVMEHGEEGAREIVKERLLGRLEEIYGENFHSIASLYKVLKRRGLPLDGVKEEMRESGKMLSRSDITSLRFAALGKMTLEQLLEKGELERLVRLVPKTISLIFDGGSREDYLLLAKVYSYLKGNPESSEQEMSRKLGVRVYQLRRLLHKFPKVFEGTPINSTSSRWKLRRT